MLKPMPDNDIKAEVFAPVKKKKQAAEITPKPRTALLQEGENAVTEEEKQLFSDAIIPSKEITKVGIVLFKGGKENVAISAPKTTAGNLSQSLKIQFGSFSIDLNKEDEINKKHVMPCPIKFKGVNLMKRKGSDIMSKPRTALFQGGEDDESMTPQTISASKHGSRDKQSNQAQAKLGHDLKDVFRESAKMWRGIPTHQYCPIRVGTQPKSPIWN